ncbi:unnamed protein product [Prorocentrum cordatum]|uniref:Uncharacterized protein n=1 Tax=Prorocentrum cordatum TaxID=2364126 RepID=A0ABN9VZ86_9DINO|nr:unnamed protein product [Polarella glacialis]
MCFFFFLLCAYAANSSSAEEAVGELDLLLTGGRLTPHNKQVVEAAYASAGLKGAQQAILLTPEFQTLGSPQPNGTREDQAEEESHTPDSYKAVVMLFLHGGADTYNLIVPIGCPLYNEYAGARTNMGVSQSALLPTTTTGQVCSSFGVHPAMPFLHQLYDSRRQAAFVSNVGALVEPTTKERWKNGEADRCLGIFSHNHQQNAAQTLKCQEAGAVPRGVGGRVADVLASVHKKTVASFSVSGISTWSVGFNTSTEIIHPEKGAIRFEKFQDYASSIQSITQQRYGNVYCEEYATSFADHIRSSEELGTLFDQIELETVETYETETRWPQSSSISPCPSRISSTGLAPLG